MKTNPKIHALVEALAQIEGGDTVDVETIVQGVMKESLKAIVRHYSGPFADFISRFHVEEAI